MHYTRIEKANEEMPRLTQHCVTNEGVIVNSTGVLTIIAMTLNVVRRSTRPRLDVAIPIAVGAEV